MMKILDFFFPSKRIAIEKPFMDGVERKTENYIPKKPDGTPFKHHINSGASRDNKRDLARVYQEGVSKNIQRKVGEDVAPGTKVSSAMDAQFKNVGSRYNNFESQEIVIRWLSDSSFPGFETLAILAQNTMMDKICSIIGEDAISGGYRIEDAEGESLDKDLENKLKRINKRYGVQGHLKEFSKFARVFGLRIVMFKIRHATEDYYINPFNPEGVTKGSYQGIVQIDPYWCSPILDSSAATDPTSVDFHEPTYWQVGGMKIHKSHLVIGRGREVADILKPTYRYGGISVPQALYQQLYAAEKTSQEIPALVATKRLISLTTDMERVLADPQAFESKLSEFTRYRDNNGVYIKGEDETLDQHDTTLTDLDAVVSNQDQRLATYSGIPAERLLETTPKGFNATGEYVYKNYQKRLENEQENVLNPLLERHLLYVALSELDDRSAEFRVNWNPTDTPSAEEKSIINERNARAAKILYDTGALDGEDIRHHITEDNNSVFTGLDPEKVIEPPHGEYDESVDFNFD